MIDHIVVTVPAADEEDEIADCLLSIQAAAAHVHEHYGVTAHVVVALDDCHDATASVVRRFAGVRVVETTARRVGTARRLAAEHAIAHRGLADRLWLASTDADCRVPITWLSHIVDAAAEGAELLIGTLRPAPGLPAAVERAWYERHDLSDGHPHIHGANLAISATAYLAIGGWLDLAAHEDVDLVERAVAAGVSIRRSGASPVVTSARTSGRASHGFAAYLERLHATIPNAV